MRSLVTLALVWLSLSSTVNARDIFVNNLAGDDKRQGSAPALQGGTGGPLRTITRALQLASAGDRIDIANTGEPYRESITLQAGRHSGSRWRPFEIIGNGAVIDGANTIPVEHWEFVQKDLYRFRPPFMSFTRLHLDGNPTARLPSHRGGPALPALAPLQSCNCEGYQYFRVERGRHIGHYPFSYTALPVGITLYEVRYVVIRDLVVRGFRLDGINAHDSAFDVTLIGVNCQANGRSGFSIGGASRVKLGVCLAAGNGTAQLRTEGYSRAELINCDLQADDALAPAVVREGGRVSVVEAPGG